jgi:hypothetical protein
MMKVNRSVWEGWCSTAIVIVFAAAMLAASIAPSYASAGADNIRNPDGADDYGTVAADEFKNLKIRG